MVKPWLYSLAALAGFLIAVYIVVVYGLPLLLPFVIALVVAELIEPVVAAVTRREKVSRTVATTVTLLLFTALITMAVTAGIGRLAQELGGIQAQLPILFAMTMDLAERFSLVLGALHASLPSSAQQLIGANLASLQGSLSSHLPDLTKTLGVVSSLPSFIMNTLIALLATFFMSRDRHEIGAFLLSLFPGVWRRKIRLVKAEVWSSAMGWAKAQFLLVSLTAVETIIGLAIIGSNYSVLMGIVIGIFDLMPLLGPATIFLPWILYLLLFGSKAFAVKLLVIYAIGAVVRQILEPKLLADRIGLHPLGILVSIYLGFQVFGALGFVIGPLIGVLLKAMIHSGLLPIFQDEPPV
jgi:sporulation integral membrane protein YtvI